MRAGIALGSNIEPRLLFLQAARRHLLALHSGADPVLSSKVYETIPLDCPHGSPLFLNAVLEINANMTPDALFACMRTIEKNMGRPHEHPRNAPRTIDLDLLYFGEIESQEPALTLPHPRLAERRFVLQPLADIRASLVLPTFKRTVNELLTEASNDQVVNVYCDAIY